MLRTFQFRLKPNVAQAAALEHILADSCETYNAALQERIEAWKLERKHVTLYDQQKELTQLRKDKRFATIAADIQREPLRRLDNAFRAFLRRCKAGEKPGFPRYRSLKRYNSFAFGNKNVVIRARSISIPRLGDVRMRGGRPTSGCVKVCRIKRNGNRWTAGVVCDVGPAPEKCAVSNPIGIDLGITNFVMLSDGQSIDNPRWTRKYAARITAASRTLARKQKRSKNSIRALEVLRRVHQSEVSARKNFTHQVSRFLISKYDLIVHENLKIANLVRGNLISTSIFDAAWGQLLFQLAYKAESAGTHVIAVNPRNTSQKCSGCGIIVKKKLSERQHSCICGVSLDRDHNAALNILALGTSAAGESLHNLS